MCRRKLKKTIYIETSIISYLVGGATRDLLIAARQEMTKEWFESYAGKYSLFISSLVYQEISKGNALAVEKRLDAVKSAKVLELTNEANELARALIEMSVIPRTSVGDSLHIAVSAVSGMDFLVSWNFKHISGASIRLKIAEAIETYGYVSPVICTPEELLEE